jgi:hypothetical protein
MSDFGLAHGMSEFINGLNGDCIETAMAAAIAAAHGESMTPAELADIVKSMQAEHLAATNGATTINACATWLKEHGEHVLVAVGYAEPFHGDWHALLLEHAGVHPIVLNVANAQALHDAQTNAWDEHGVKYHGIAVLDKGQDGYSCVDGDNPQANQRFQVYTYQTLIAAKPCGMVVIDVLHPAPVPAPKPEPKPTPAPSAPTPSDEVTALKARVAAYEQKIAAAVAALK